jgi:hypothetical protein
MDVVNVSFMIPLGNLPVKCTVYTFTIVLWSSEHVALPWLLQKYTYCRHGPNGWKAWRKEFNSFFKFFFLKRTTVVLILIYYHY